MVHGSLSPVLNIGRGNRAAGSIEQRGFLQKVSLTVTDLPPLPSSAGANDVFRTLDRSGHLPHMGPKPRIRQTNQSHNDVRGRLTRDRATVNTSTAALRARSAGSKPPEKKSKNNPMQRTKSGAVPPPAGPRYRPPSSAAPADGFPPATAPWSGCGSAPRSSGQK